MLRGLLLASILAPLSLAHSGPLSDLLLPDACLQRNPLAEIEWVFPENLPTFPFDSFTLARRVDPNPSFERGPVVRMVQIGWFVKGPHQLLVGDIRQNPIDRLSRRNLRNCPTRSSFVALAGFLLVARVYERPKRLLFARNPRRLLIDCGLSQCLAERVFSVGLLNQRNNQERKQHKMVLVRKNRFELPDVLELGVVIKRPSRRRVVGCIEVESPVSLHQMEHFLHASQPLFTFFGFLLRKTSNVVWENKKKMRLDYF